MTKSNGKLKKIIQKRVPILGWLPKYNTDTAIADVIAGITVGLTVMPQALAYAALAGLQPQYGLYSSFVGCFVYTIFGSCKDITIGPTALMSLMTNQQVVGRNPDYAILLCFLTGIVLIVMALMRLGVLVEFISQPVTVGFTTATSVIIMASQIKGLLGLSYGSGNFLWTVRAFMDNVHDARWQDALLGFSCIAILLFLRKVKDLYTVDKQKLTKNERIITKSLWLLSTSRNALVVILCSILALVLENNFGSAPFKITGPVRSGIPPVQMPPFSTVLQNRTIHFSEMVSDLGSSIILIPVIAVLGNVAIAKAFAGGEPVDATQELLTLAGCNLFGSFVSSMPVTGSFSRSAVNHASGVKTTMGGVFTGILLLLALGVLTPYFYYIPKAALAAVIICAVIFMIEYEVIKPMWRASKRDLLPMLVTFVVCLISGVEIGILVGVGVNIALLLIYSARPKIVTSHLQGDGGVEYIVIKPNSSIYFPGVEYLRNTVITAGKSKLPIVLDCTLFENTDFTTAKGVSSLINDFKKKQQPFLFYNVQSSLASVLEPICLTNFVYFSDMEDLKEALNVAVKSRGDVDEILRVTTEMRDVTLFHRGHTQNEGEPMSENSDPLLGCQKRAAVVSMTRLSS